MWPVYGVDQPIWGYLYRKRVVDIGRAAYRCALGRFVAPKIEPEIVLHFGVTPAPGADVQAILACVDWIAHGYEIVQSHYPDWKFQVTDAIADSSLHGELLLGERVPVARLGGDVVAALAEFSVELFCDGALREVGFGANVLGSPLSAIAHLSSVLAQQPDHPPLQAGEMVTTGTLTAAFSVSAGETWTTQLHDIGLPNLAVTFVL